MRGLKITNDKKQIVCLAVLYYVMFIGFFTWNFGIPETAYYLADVLIIILMAMCIKRIPKSVGNRDIRPFTRAIILLVVIGTFSAIFQSFNMALWAWSIRNWGRLIVYFYLCISCLKTKVIDRAINFFIRLYDINTFVVLIQFLFLRSNYGADQLNGLFGRTTSGINVTVSLLVYCIVLSGFFVKKYSVQRLITTIIEIGLVAVVAELRAVLIFMVVILIVYLLVNFKFTFKQFLKYFALAAAVIVAMVIASNYLVKLYPQFEGFFNIKRIIADASIEGGYGYTGYIDRLNAIPVINKYFFDKTGIWNKLFGIGIGNAEYSTADFLTSAFYNQYGQSFRYLNFTSSMLYLEVGLVGLVLYAAAFISLFIKYARLVKHNVGKTSYYSFYDNIGAGAALISILFIVYNNLQRTDAGVILALFLAVPIVIRKGKRYGEVY